jgi:hypothetical protein
MAKPKLKKLPKVPTSTDPNVQAAWRKKCQDIQKENKKKLDEYEKGLKLKKENQNLRAKGAIGK